MQFRSRLIAAVAVPVLGLGIGLASAGAASAAPGQTQTIHLNGVPIDVGPATCVPGDVTITGNGVEHMTTNSTGFWVTGTLSAFLDNAPTYLVFFNLAGGDPSVLMGPLKNVLAAISAGAVYFGALTYVGNAPNFMIKAIAENRGVAMPSFFGYLAYAAVLLLPLFAMILWIAL